MRPDEPQAKREFSLTTLFSDLTREFSTLVRQETQLIKAEVSEKVADAKSGAGELLAGGGLLLAGFLVLLLALVAFIADLLGPAALDYPWLAPLVVGLSVAALGVGLLLLGSRNLKAGALAPRRSADSLRGDTDVLKQQFK